MTDAHLMNPSDIDALLGGEKWTCRVYKANAETYFIFTPYLNRRDMCLYIEIDRAKKVLDRGVVRDRGAALAMTSNTLPRRNKTLMPMTGPYYGYHWRDAAKQIGTLTPTNNLAFGDIDSAAYAEEIAGLVEELVE